MNPIYALMQRLPTNGWWTVIASLLPIVFGISGMAIGHLDTKTGIEAISTGLIGLGLGNKLEKAKAEFLVIKALLPQGILDQLQ